MMDFAHKDAMMWCFAYAAAWERDDLDAVKALLPPPNIALASMTSCMLGLASAIGRAADLSTQEVLLNIQGNLLKEL